MSRSIKLKRVWAQVLLLACFTALTGCTLFEKDSETEWCINVEHAQMWPIDQPELAESVSADRGGPPIGCQCFDDAEVQILAEEAPVAQYDELVDRLEENARNECAWAVPQGYDHSCYLEDGPLAPNLTVPYSNADGVDVCG
jgi:hypothetical protein